MVKVSKASENLYLVKRPDRSSIYKGVIFDKKKVKMIARPSIKGRQVQLGKVQHRRRGIQYVN